MTTAEQQHKPLYLFARNGQFEHTTQGGTCVYDEALEGSIRNIAYTLLRFKHDGKAFPYWLIEIDTAGGKCYLCFNSRSYLFQRVLLQLASARSYRNIYFDLVQYNEFVNGRYRQEITCYQDNIKLCPATIKIPSYRQSKVLLGTHTLYHQDHKKRLTALYNVAKSINSRIKAVNSNTCV